MGTVSYSASSLFVPDAESNDSFLYTFHIKGVDCLFAWLFKKKKKKEEEREREKEKKGDRVLR